MEKYGFVKWTDNKETFTITRGCTTRASETESKFFVIDAKRLKEIPIPIDSSTEVFISKN